MKYLKQTQFLINSEALLRKIKDKRYELKLQENLID